jgi:anti-anti-sigma factor
MSLADPLSHDLGIVWLMENHRTAERLGTAARQRSVVVDHHDRGDEVVVTLRDAEALHALGDLRWRLNTLLAQGPATLVIDIEGVRQISSTMIAVLLQVKRRCRARRVDVVLREPSRRSLDFLHRTGLLAAFVIEPDDLAPRHPRRAQSARRRRTQ